MQDKKLFRTCMCESCPQLQKRLRGLPTPPEGTTGGTGLCCGNCGTTLEATRMGHPLGCPECYQVFGNVLVAELIIGANLPKRAKTTAKPLHVGRSPGEANKLTPSLQLVALNQTLSDTLKREDYEQAAWLRDQIKLLTDEMTEEKDKNSEG